MWRLNIFWVSNNSSLIALGKFIKFKDLPTFFFTQTRALVLKIPLGHSRLKSETQKEAYEKANRSFIFIRYG